MNKQDVTRVIKGVTRAVSKRSPEILTGIGIAGMITTTILAVKATPKAMRLIEEEKEKHNEETLKEARANGRDCCNRIDELPPIEVVKVAWKPYVPAIIAGVTSIACLIGANSVHARRNAAIATAYKISETALTEYREKVVETIGEKKEQTVREKVAQKKIEDNPIGGNNEVIITNRGNMRCYDCISGRYFDSDIDKIKRVVNDLNYRMMNEMYISLTDFYMDLGLRPTKGSDDLGWNLDKGLIEVQFSSHLSDDGTPCIVLDYLVAPRYDYAKLM